MSADKTLDRLVREDKAIETKQDSATLALMEHRWKAVNEEHDGKRYTQQAYADATHKAQSVISNYVRAWDTWTKRDRRTAITPADVLAQAKLGIKQAEAAQIVADAAGVKLDTVAQQYGYQQEVRRVRAEIEEGQQAFVDEGHELETARELAAEAVRGKLERDRRVADRHAEQRQADQDNKPRVIRDLEYEMLQAKVRLRKALVIAVDATIDEDDEYVDLLKETLDKVRQVLDLLNLAIVGEAKIDWDAELSKLTDQ